LEVIYLVSISVVSLAGFIIKLGSGPKPALEAVFDSVILLTLLFVIGLLLRLQNRQQVLLPIEIITDTKELYNHFFFELARSEEKICLSHVRHMEFSQSKVSSDFQDRLLGWAAQRENNQVFRMVAVTCRDDQSNNIALNLAIQSIEIDGYIVRGLNWEPTTPMTNFAIFDSRVAFVCFYEGRDENGNRALLWAIRVSDPTTITRLGKYFETLWADNELLDENAMIRLLTPDNGPNTTTRE